MKNALKWLAGPAYRRYHDLLLRVAELETSIDCLIESPTWVESEAIGFNGQRHRKRIFLELLNALRFEAIIETGTFLGNTTGYLATTSRLPVQTCESRKRFRALAQMRLRSIPNITFTLSDSRSFLVDASRTTLAAKRSFFYLDAHWYQDLPLREEVEIISKHWTDFAIMIDDFEVPGDAGYGYDTYGKTKLSIDDFGGLFSDLSLVPFFPSLPSSAETGGRAGCVILVRKGRASEIVGGLSSLRTGIPLALVGAPGF